MILSLLSFWQGVSGALAVLMKDAIKPTLMQTLEVRHKHNNTQRVNSFPDGLTIVKYIHKIWFWEKNNLQRTLEKRWYIDLFVSLLFILLTV